ncbi:HDOD domain-containing protein [Thermosulfuriphilus sp.]
MILTLETPIAQKKEGLWPPPILISPGEAAWGQSPKSFETILGACVGVAIYDLKKHIGGLIHVVLPRGPKANEEENPFRYARSGLPLLYEKILSLGARPGDLVAAMAGGATVLGKENPQAVGPRNILAAKEILKNLKIPVVREEIAGRHPRRLFLDLASLKVNISASPRPDLKSSTPQKAPLLKDLRAVEERIDSLRPQAEVAIRVWNMARDPYVDFSRLEKEVLKDQALTANILKICNSAFYGLKESVSSISQALALLGLETFRKAAMVSCLAGLYDRDLSGYQLERKGLFRHALACASLAELIVRKKGLSSVISAEEIYIAGLIHDIGKILLDEFAKDLFDEILRLVFFHNRLFLEAERELLGTDHATIGGIIARDWGFPPLLVEAIVFHHEPTLAPRYPQVASVIHLANILCSFLGIGGGQGSFSNPLDPQAIKILGLEDTDSLMDEACELVGTLF